MKNHEKPLKNYLNSLKTKIGEKNAGLINAFARKLRALPNEPQPYRILTVCTRLKTISKILGKPLDNVTEKDLIRLNTAMRDREMKSAAFYRKTLKQFLRLTDKKKFFDLIDSDYLRSPSRKNGHHKLVNPNEFWNSKQIAAYIEESKKHGLRQTAFAGLLLSTGCRPHELLNMKKENVEFENGTLTVRVVDGKTGSRVIFLDGNQASAVQALAKPYLETLKPNAQLFPDTYQNRVKIHRRLCDFIGIPKGNSQKFYIFRKMALTGFYDKYGVVKGAALAGHVPGSNSMKHYVGMSLEQLKTGVAKLEQKTCPSPKCGFLNNVTKLQCEKCSAPLDRTAYVNLVKATETETKTRIESLEEKLELTQNKLGEVLQALEKAVAK